MTILEVRNEYIAQYKGLLGTKFARIKSCAGRWSEEQVRAYSAELPALYIALLGVSNISVVSGTHVEATVELALYVFCSESCDESAENVAAAVVQDVILATQTIAHADFIHSADVKHAQNLYSKKLNDIDVALWGVRLEQSAWVHMSATQSIQTIENTSILGG